MSHREPVLPAREGWLLSIWCILLLLLCLGLHSRHNDFPYFYHPDEPGKVEQLLTGEWNFNHPMLLLNTTRAAMQVAEIPKEEQPVVETGRWVSAVFTSIAVVALSLLAYAWRGWAAAIAAGGALALHHQLYELSHYLKEDPALLAGMSLTFVMIFACWWRPNAWRTALLGIACALAASGKYLGLVGLALAIPVLWQASKEHRTRRFAVFAAAFAVAFAIINLPLFLHFSTFQGSFGKEMNYVVHGQRGMTRSVPHTQYWNIFIDNTTPVIWVLLGFFFHARWKESKAVRDRLRLQAAHWGWKRSYPAREDEGRGQRTSLPTEPASDRHALSLPEMLLILFPIVFTLVLSFSPKSNDRYYLPCSAVFTLLAACGAMDFARAVSYRHMRRRWVWGAVAALILGQLPSLWKYERAFQIDDTQDLITFLNTEVSPQAVLAKENRVQLPDPNRKKHASRMGVIPQKLIAERFVADLGTLDELRQKGITHVIVSEMDYGRFFLKNLRPQEKEKADYDRRKAFYTELLRAERPIKLIFDREKEAHPVVYLHPGIRVYEIGTAK